MNDESTGAERSDKADINANVENLLRGLSDSDTELIAPPAGLWNRIEAEVRTDASTELPPSDPPGSDPPASVLAEGVISLDSRRRRPSSAVLLAAAAAIVVVLGIGITLFNRDASPQQIAQADLTYDPAAFDPLGADAKAHATLLDEDGTFTLQIDESTLPSAAGADLEVWLIEPDGDGNPADLVSLGTIDPDDPSGLTVPSSHDPDVFYVVDISIEPRDGDAAHSGRSILRGALTST